MPCATLYGLLNLCSKLSAATAVPPQKSEELSVPNTNLATHKDIRSKMSRQAAPKNYQRMGQVAWERMPKVNGAFCVNIW